MPSPSDSVREENPPKNKTRGPQVPFYWVQVLHFIQAISPLFLPERPQGPSLEPSRRALWSLHLWFTWGRVRR